MYLRTNERGSHIEGILPKGPYLPCVSMAGRALLAGYPRCTLDKARLPIDLWDEHHFPLVSRTIFLVCDLNRTPIDMAKHGGSCVHFSGISTCRRTSRETVSHPQCPPLPTLCKISLPIYVIVTNKLLQPLTTTWYDSLVLSFSLLKI